MRRNIRKSRKYSKGKRIKHVSWNGGINLKQYRHKVYHAKVYRNIKDHLFRFLFGKNREVLLQLYNALSGTDYQDVSGMEIVTIESAVYIVMNNDVAFIFAGALSLYEHQSTKNGNMPVRFLLYLVEEYQKIIEKAETSLYGSRRIVLPIPKCIVFYNGETDAGENAEESWEVYLSDAFVSRKKIPKKVTGWVTGRTTHKSESITLDKEMSADVEVRVHVLNINYGHNQKLMEKCPLLGEYSHFVAVSREYLAKGLDRQEAYEMAIDYCMEHDILRSFLKENREKVLGMLLREFDVEKYERTIREEGKEEGREEGKIQGELNMLFSLVHQGLLSAHDASKQTAMTEQEFSDAITSWQRSSNA